jgi:hypothetical protein
MKIWILGLLVFAFAIPAKAQHEVDLSAADTSCTTAATCTLQVYRGTGSAPTSYTLLAGAAAGTATASTTTWTYADTSSTLTAGTVYTYYVTATFSSGGAASASSNTFQVTIVQTPPIAPTLTGKQSK